MKLYSWNVNGLRAVIRKGALRDFLASEQPDILCLQEIKAKKDQVEIDLPDYTEFWNPAIRPGYAGTATFVRNGLVQENVNNASEGNPQLRPPLGTRNAEGLRGLSDEARDDRPLGRGTQYGPEERPEEALLHSLEMEGRILTLDIGPFYLVNVYTPNSKTDLSRLEIRKNLWDPAFLNYLLELEKVKPVVTCGDFNAAHEEIDLARPKTNHHNAGFTDEERSGIDNIINAGFIDTFRHFHPEEQRYSWWSHWGNARANNVGWRIDYFFASKSLLPKIISAEIHENILGSDHCPVSLELGEEK